MTALVLAPAELADHFDELGCLDAERWNARALPLPLERWRVVDRPEDQARAALRALAEVPGRPTPDELRVTDNPDVREFLDAAPRATVA